MKKTVSIVIPMYNMEKYIESCLVSACEQSYRELDIVVVNDGSTDMSLEIANELANKDSRIRIFSKPNAGLSHTRNYGIDKAVGEYILFLDSDDELERDAVSQMIKYALEYDCDIVNGCITRFGADSGDRLKIPSLAGLYEGASLDEVKRKICIGADEALLNLYSKIYRKSLLSDNGIYARSLVSGDDAAFALEAVFAAEKIYFAYDVKHYRYRTNPMSFTNKWIPIDKRIEYSRLFFTELYSILDKFNGEGYKALLDSRRALSIYDFSMLAISNAGRGKKAVLSDLEKICSDDFHLDNAAAVPETKSYVNIVLRLAKKKKLKRLYYMCKFINAVKKRLR